MTSEQPGPVSTAVARRFLQGVTVVGVFLLLAAAWHFQLAMTGRAVAWYGLGLAVMGTGLLPSRLAPAIQVGLTLFCLTSAGTLLLAEWALERYSRIEFVESQKAVAAATGIPFDARTIPQVVRDLRAGGTAAVPSIVPKILRQYTADATAPIHAFQGPVFPLAGVANRVTVQLCNEDGRYPLYSSDRHGFHNPAGVWDSTPADIVFIGDSYTHGYCVPADSALPDLFRPRWPRTFNLGTGGSGPLAELGTLREYGLGLQPRLVVWMYCENDLRDLMEEREHPVLIRYLDSNYTQHLFGAQAAIDSALLPWIDRVYRDGSGPSISPDAGWRQLVTFTALRQLIFSPQVERSSIHEPGQIPLFKRILTEAAREVRAQGGRMLFVYIPAWERYYAAGTIGDDRARKMVLEAAQGLGLPVLDLTPIVAASSDRALLFGRRNLRSSHFSSAGYLLSSRAIMARIDSAGLLPPAPHP